jgi:hypothetical protein
LIEQLNKKHLYEVKETLKEFKKNNEISKYIINNKGLCLQNKTEGIKLPQINIKNNVEENTELKNYNIKKNNKYVKEYQCLENRSTCNEDFYAVNFREDYSMWLPPENQCGDGKTRLNQKFGY